VVVAIVVASAGAGCGDASSPADSIGTSAIESTTTTSTVLARSAGEVASTGADPAAIVPVTAPNGRAAPLAPASAEQAAELFAEGVRALRDTSRMDDHPDLGHQQQVVVRSVARNPDWVDAFLAGLPPDVADLARMHLDARADLGRLHTAPPLENIPAWEIIEPEPLDALITHYQEAESATGIDWRILAAINLVETGMGRIDGLSSAGAQGPMQFLPTTWEEVAEGGDIDDPRDAIQGAARYLVRRGGLDDIRAGLWGYNNSDDYVDAVLTYADLLAADESAIRGIYHWEIYVGTESGTLWLPVGFRADEPVPAADYLADNPWAQTLRVSP